MSLTAGIVGLPNVGKSTLFNAITNSDVVAENYPFATIEPNTGTVEVSDKRLDVLTKMFNSAKTVPAIFEFRDIAGLVEGASKGEGLGNQFLSHIRETDAICHVVRCFDDNDIIHVSGSVNPVRDAEIIDLELILADLEVVTKRIDRVENKARVTKDADSVAEYTLLKQIEEVLTKEKPARTLSFTPAQMAIVKSFNLLTLKPIIYIANIAEEDLADPTSNKYYQELKGYADAQGATTIEICAKVEQELVSLSKEEKELFLQDLGVDESGLDKVIHAAFSILGLRTFFTAGPIESKAWTFKDGMKAPECAGIIHTDFQKGFIKAEIYSYDDLIASGSESKLKEDGKFRIEGKEYVMKDGDIVHFRFNV